MRSRCRPRTQSWITRASSDCALLVEFGEEVGDQLPRWCGKSGNGSLAARSARSRRSNVDGHLNDRMGPDVKQPCA